LLLLMLLIFIAKQEKKIYCCLEGTHDCAFCFATCLLV
jgi:hypothetical protein